MKPNIKTSTVAGNEGHIPNGAQQLLSALWRSPDLQHQFADRGFRAIVASDLTSALATECTDPEVDYFACAEYTTTENRKAENAAGAYALWMDVDCGAKKAATGDGYETIDLAEVALGQFCAVTGIPQPTHRVHSGGGLHLYWVVDTFLAADQWVDPAKQLKVLCKAHGFRADPTRTADIASILRVPGTVNFKYTPPRPVALTKSAPALNSEHLLAAIRSAHARLAANQKDAAVLPAEEAPGVIQTEVPSRPVDIQQLERVLSDINPDSIYDDWMQVLMASFHETQGSDAGLALVIEWSSKGGKFKGEKEIRDKWKSFRLDIPNPVTMGTLIKMAQEAEAFEPVASEIELPGGEASMPIDDQRPMTQVSDHPFAEFSLRGQADDLEKSLVEQVPILGGIALKGQATVIYASPNTGKTLLTLNLICEGVERRVIDPDKLFYLNMDDHGAGLVEKLNVAELHGFHMLAEGHNGFQAKLFPGRLQQLIDSRQTPDTILVLDTLKKFADLMDKGNSSKFTVLIRSFVMAGGTVIALAHTNKNPGRDGKPMYGGTSDIVDDFDCAYTLATVPQQSNATLKVVEFDNIKRRGNVAQSAAYGYSTARESGYTALLRSVREVDPLELVPMKEAAEQESDAPLIAAIRACIDEGNNMKMALAKAAAARAKASRNAALHVLDKYTGEDPIRSQWRFGIGARGAKIYQLLQPSIDLKA